MNSIIQADVESVLREPLPWQLFAGANVLVTGAAGFLPAYMVETLLQLNRSRLAKPAQVTALVRNKERALRRFAAYRGQQDLLFLEHDVSEPMPASEPFDYIIHAASNASPIAYLKDPAGTIAANVLGTYHLLNTAARDKVCKGFLFFSSGEIYGQVEPRATPLTESDGGYLDPASVRACYGESKRIGETMCASWARQHGVPTRMVRPGHTYGPGMKLDDGRVFADFVRDILHGGPIVLQSDGRARRYFCYLADATAAFFTVLLKGGAGEAYNVINTDADCSIADLADRLGAIYRSEGVRVTRMIPQNPSTPRGAQPGIPISVDKIGALGWRPKTTIEDGFRRTVDSFREGFGDSEVAEAISRNH